MFLKLKQTGLIIIYTICRSKIKVRYKVQYFSVGQIFKPKISTNTNQDRKGSKTAPIDSPFVSTIIVDILLCLEYRSNRRNSR
jgi:hypothetical protein